MTRQPVAMPEMRQCRPTAGGDLVTIGLAAATSPPRRPTCGAQQGEERFALLLSAPRDGSNAEAGGLRLMPDPFRIYALAAFRAASNTSRADVVPATCSVPSTPRFIHPAFTALEHFFGRSGVGFRDAE